MATELRHANGHTNQERDAQAERREESHAVTGLHQAWFFTNICTVECIHTRAPLWTAGMFFSKPLVAHSEARDSRDSRVGNNARRRSRSSNRSNRSFVDEQVRTHSAARVTMWSWKP